MGQSSQGGMNRAEKRVGVDDSGGSNTATGMGGAQPAAPKAPADFTKTRNAGAGAILQRNQGLSQEFAVRRVAGDAVRNLQGNQADLQNRQTQYLDKGRQGIADTSKGLGEDDVRNALRSGGGDLRSRLDAGPVSVQDFDAGQFAPVDSIQYLRTGDVGGLLGRESGANYTQGMGALDALAFNRSGAGQQVRQQVGGLQSAFSSELEKALGKEGAAATLKKEAESANERGKADLRGQIERISQGIVGGLGQRKEKARNENASVVRDQQENARSEIQKIISEYRNKLAEAGRLPSGNATALSPAEYELDRLSGVDFDSRNKGVKPFSGLDRYITTTNPELADNQFLTDEEVGMLNTGAGLLGSGQVYQRGQAGQAGASLNAKALRAEIERLINPTLQKAESDRQAAIETAAKRAAAEKTQAAVKSGDSNSMTGAATGGNEGVTGSMKKQTTPTTPSGAAKSAVEKVAEKAKKAVEEAKKNPKKTVVKILSGGLL